MKYLGKRKGIHQVKISHKIRISFLEDQVKKKDLLRIISELSKSDKENLYEEVGNHFRYKFQISLLLNKIDEVINTSNPIKVEIGGEIADIYFWLKRGLILGTKNCFQIKIVNLEKVRWNTHQSIFGAYMKKFVQSYSGTQVILVDGRESCNIYFNPKHFSINLDIFSIQSKYLVNSKKAAIALNKKSLVRDKNSGLDVDVIVPTKNVALETLKVCLESIRKELRENDRVYVIDDNEIPDSNIKKFVQKYGVNWSYLEGPRMGIGAARNVGLKIGKNPLISFIDSDDYIKTGFLSKQIITHEKFPAIAATGTWLKAFGLHSGVYPQWENIKILGVTYCLPPAGILMWKRIKLKKLGGFDEKFTKAYEDFDICARASSLDYPIVIVDELLYMYRRVGNSLSTSLSAIEERQLYLQVLENNLRGLNTEELALMIDVLTRYGKSLPHMSLDELNPKFLTNDIGLFKMLISKYRNEKIIRNDVHRILSKIGVLSLLYYTLSQICSLLDFLYYEKNSKILAGLYRIVREKHK